jgi:hypothetical protein
MDRMKLLVEAIKGLSKEEFSGYIKINFSQGSLGRVEKSEEIEDSATESISLRVVSGGKDASMKQMKRRMGE